MSHHHAVVAVFAHHEEADAAVRKLAEAGLDMKHFSVVGKGYHTEEKVVGFYNTGDRMKFWGKHGAFWGGLWGLLFGGILFTIPVVGHVMVLGHLAAMVYGAVEGAIVVGGLSALGAALYSIGIPKNSVIRYEEALKADAFLVVAQGTPDEMARTKDILAMENPERLDLHEDVKAPAPAESHHAGHAHQA
ncbi:general stress protein [Herbaspirillum sp. ST 5-3]|uniref:general stress protein n=1 Tax=Oxalobacteraceae TaxID=75682 RepID=UPI0010A41566|nr:general stress protein [Herbaspirillum sp. ST 5-3]